MRVGPSPPHHPERAGASIFAVLPRTESQEGRIGPERPDRGRNHQRLLVGVLETQMRVLGCPANARMLSVPPARRSSGANQHSTSSHYQAFWIAAGTCQQRDFSTAKMLMIFL